MKRTAYQTLWKHILALALFPAMLLTPTTPARAAVDVHQVLARMEPIRAAVERGSDPLWREALDRAMAQAINPGDYQCGPTEFGVWFDERFAPLNWLYSSGYTDVAIVCDLAQTLSLLYALYYGDGPDEYLGPGGCETQELTKRLKDCQRFWDSYCPGIQLRGWHGSVLADTTKMVRLLTEHGDLFGIDADGAVELVDYVQFWLQVFPEMGFDNPLWTLNFYSLRSGVPEAGLPELANPLILIGDGCLELFSDVGLGANAPDVLFAHEFAHQVQYQLGIWEETGPETTRHTELMADAFGAYYCAHSRGASFQTKRIVDTYRALYLVGDCAFDSLGHHGTPKQREAAAKWGIALAESAQKQGFVKPSGLLFHLFEEAYPALIAPDDN